jgi:predicted N-acetyltransferase YhbS
MPSLTSIRIATARDIPAIVAVVNPAFQVEIFLSGTRTDEKNVADHMQKGEFLVMEDSSGHIISSVYVELRGERGYFGMLAVEPSLQGKGLGRTMIEQAQNYVHAHGCNYMDIKVLSARTELPPYYRKLGYAETGTEEFHPTRPLKPGIECHCIIMSKQL